MLSNFFMLAVKARVWIEELFDDLICLDEEGESLESSTSGNLPEIKQKTRHSGMQSESCVNHRKKHDNIPRCRFSGDRQMSPRYCFHEKTSDVKRIDFYGDAKSNRMRRMGNTNEFTIDTNLLEVDSCEGDDSDFSESGKNLSLNQSPGKGENRVDVSLTSSMALQIYGDDEDWPYLSGDVDEEAVRLAASLDPDVTEAKDDSQQGPRKEWNAMEMEKRTNRWNAQQYCNSNGSSHHSKTSDKLDGIWSLHLWKSILQLFVSCRHDSTQFSSVILKVQKMLFQADPQQYWMKKSRNYASTDGYGKMTKIGKD
uniref:Uncharacterized protein n=1 Tax=Wuchereria bancrofti TaxID=6293 RepID=A0A1I8EI35_WUCBA